MHNRDRKSYRKELWFHVKVTNGKLDFGPWGQVFNGEFDGDRRKRALVKTIGD